MKKEKLLVNHYLTKDYEALEHISSKKWENCRGLESGPERGGIGSVIELAMAKQVHEKIDHFTTALVGVLTSPKTLSKSLVY